MSNQFNMFHKRGPQISAGEGIYGRRQETGDRRQKTEAQKFRSSGVQEFRSSGVQEFRSSGVQEPRHR
jgi:hypothetical protein